MPETDPEAGLEKAITFFERAEEIASTDNFNYAIDMYIEGLRRAPDAVEDGHIPLRRIALIRQGKGGKKPSLIDKMKKRRGKSPLDEMLNAEYLLAKGPDHLPYAEAMLKACVAGSYGRTADWIAQLIFDANRASAKPSLATYLLLRDSYKSLEMFSKAVEACRCAVELKSDDDILADELRNLTAQMTVKQGKYEQEGDFRQSILDRKKQEMLHSQESLFKSAEFLAKAVEAAREQLQAKPDSPANISKLADAIFELQTDDADQEAFGILADAFAKTGDFAFKRREGEFRIKRIKRDIRQAKTVADSDPENEELKEELAQRLEQFGQVELEHWGLCVENYPTDLRMKYEYGVRLLLNKQYDKAIPLFQEAQRSPQCRIVALDKMGLCFFLKGWFADAIDIFNRALEACGDKGSDIAKELRYNLARSYEESKQSGEALEIYRKLAQVDYNYKDVSQRVQRLRKMK
jgi:tetratricopeptide (TPR) repeat protein